MNPRSVVILGAGGHAKVLADTLRLQGHCLAGVTTPEPERVGGTVFGVPVLGGDEALASLRPDQVDLANGIGFVASPARRVQAFDRGKAAGFTFATLIHPSAIVAPDVILGEGVQILAGAVIQPGAQVGSDTIVNTRAGIDHDCQIGAHVHIAPGVTLCGGVVVGNSSLVGAGATVLQGVKIGHNCLVGGGALVRTDVADGTTVAGVPARVVIRQRH